MPGGVSNFYKTIKNKFSVDAEYFTIGARSGEKNIFSSIIRIFKDYINFFKKVKYTYYDIIQINPSLDFKSVLRDGIFILIAKLLKSKIIVFWRGWNNVNEKVLNKYYFKLMYFKSDASIVLAKEFKKKILQSGYNKPIFLLTTVVDDKFISEFKINKKSYNKSAFNILFLARIEKEKGIYEAIRTYKKLKEKYNFIRMTIAGNGPDLENVKKYVKHHDISKIEFLGFVEDDTKIKTYLNADVYFFPSYYEGMPSSVLEAMALGLPVITSSVGGLKDFFENEKMGFIVESKNVEDYASAIEKLINNKNLRAKIANFNNEYAKNNFMASKVVKKIENIYNEIV